MWSLGKVKVTFKKWLETASCIYIALSTFPKHPDVMLQMWIKHIQLLLLLNAVPYTNYT